MKDKVKMLNGNILVKPIKNESSFILDTNYDLFEAVAGEDVDGGEIVYTIKNSGIKIDIDGEKFFVVKHRDIILVK